MDDRVIIELYNSRSESAISETTLKYGHYLKKIAFNILGDIGDSEECVNDTYYKAWNVIPPQNPTILSAFLGKITRNLSLDKYKERKAQKRGGDEIPLLLTELDECLPSLSEVQKQMEDGETEKSISSFLKTINTESRVVFIRRYWYADSVYAISERYNMSQSKVKSMLFRTRNKLKLYLEKEGVSI